MMNWMKPKEREIILAAPATKKERRKKEVRI